MEALHGAQLPVISFPPSTSALTKAREVILWDTTPLEQAVQNQLLPVVHGDVVFDMEMGGTILSTEEVFTYLASRLQPQKILLAGQDPGVWADYPQCTEIIPEITPKNLLTLDLSLWDSETTDVTGGMASKVQEMVTLVERMPEVEVWIFSGQEKDNLTRALLGHYQGTLIHNR
jgi:isopentenyl phosphate kinase